MSNLNEANSSANVSGYAGEVFMLMGSTSRDNTQELCHFLPTLSQTDIDEQESQQKCMEVEAIRSHANNTSTSVLFSNSNKTEELAITSKTSKDDRQSMKKSSLHYRLYSEEQIVQFFTLMLDDGLKVKEAAAIADINFSTAYSLRLTYYRTGELPFRKPRKACTNLDETHLTFITSLIDSYPLCTLEGLREKLKANFPEVKISKAAFFRFLKSECCHSVKKLERMSECEPLEETISKRQIAAQSWIVTNELDFKTNYVFINEAWFNIHMSRTIFWPNSTNPNSTIHRKIRGVNITAFGAISRTGIIHLAARKDRRVLSVDTESEPEQPRSKSEIRSEQFLEFLDNLLDKLDSQGLQGFHLLMDNGSLFKSKGVQELTEKRGYKCVYLPAGPPSLNPIEEFWLKVKRGINRSAFVPEEKIENRIIESASKVTLNDIQGYIEHSLSLFSQSLNNQML